MIEELTSKSGKKILSSEGRLLSSKYDPIKEAEIYVESFDVNLEKFQVIFLLGAGSGYQIQEMIKRFPHIKIVCIEENIEVVRWVQQNGDYPETVHFHCRPVEDLDSSAFLQSYLGKVYYCCFNQAYRGENSCTDFFYNKYYQLLLARRLNSLEQWINLRNLSGCFPKIQPNSDGSYLTLKNFDLDASHDLEGSSILSQFYILKELIL